MGNVVRTMTSEEQAAAVEGVLAGDVQCRNCRSWIGRNQAHKLMVGWRAGRSIAVYDYYCRNESCELAIEDHLVSLRGAARRGELDLD